jgi:hypothetical protein
MHAKRAYGRVEAMDLFILSQGSIQGNVVSFTLHVLNPGNVLLGTH